MFLTLRKFIFLFLLVLPVSLLLMGTVDVRVAAQEDEVENEQELTQATEDDATEATVDEEYVEDVDDGKVYMDAEGDEILDKDDSPAATDSKTDAESTDEEEEEKEEMPKPSPDADTVILFTKPANRVFPAGEVITCLVGLGNNGDKDFIVDMVEASLRYPQDYTYYIQNFTGFQYNALVQPGNQASFAYAFKPHESFGGRPFGLTINLLYKDSEGKPFMDAVFNETVNIAESDEGIDGETFFLYVFLVAVALLLVMAGHYAFTSVKGKKSAAKPVIEMGTQQNTDIDYDWLPKETTTEFVAGKSSPRRSPRNRRQKRNTGSDE